MFAPSDCPHKFHPRPLPLKTTNLFSVLMGSVFSFFFFFFFFKILYIIEIIRCLSFYVWLISLDMVPSRPIQVVTRGRISFFYSWIIFHWMWELNCEESWALKNWFFLTVVLEKTLESLGLQGDPTSPSWRRSVLGVHWKDWCWSWNSSTLATSCEELTHWKRPWCWERLKVGGEGDNRGWDGWMASLTQWTWVWMDSRNWWWTGRPGVLRFMGLQSVGHDWVTELNWTQCNRKDPYKEWGEAGVSEKEMCSLMDAWIKKMWYTCNGIFSSVAQSCPTLCDPMNCSMPGLPVHHHLLESIQTHVHWVSDAIQPSHPLLSPSPPTFNLSQHQGLSQWVSSSHQVAKVLEFQLQLQSFQWTPRTDLL